MALGILSPAMLYCAVHAAPAPPTSPPPPLPLPDAGQTLRELQQQPTLKAPDRSAPVIETEEAGEKQGSDDFRVMVKTIRISGNRSIPLQKLVPLVADLPGAERSLADLRLGAARITRYYRDHGFAVARAYLPAQAVKEGVVWITVLEGHIDQIHLENKSRISDARAAAYLDHVKEATAIKSADIDRGLLLLDETPGVGGSRAALQPGSSNGSSDLMVVLNPAAPFSGNVSADNYGSRFTGAYRLGGNLNVDSPLGIGDLLTLGLITTGEYLQYGRLAYQMPVGADGVRVGVALFDLHYHLGKEYKTLDAHGDARSANVFVTASFIRGVRGNLTGTAGWEEKRLEDTIGSTGTESVKRIHVANLGLVGDYRDDLGAGGVSGLDLSAALGGLDIESADAELIDAVSARSRGSYLRLTLGANRLQHLTAASSILLAVSGQMANKNLDSSEKFLLGGSDGVRAYPQGEGIGDTGYLCKIELHHDFTHGLRAIAFYDDGSVSIDKTPFVFPTTSNKRDLAGAGVGLNAAVAGYEFRSTVAWRTHGGEPNSIPRSDVRTPTVLVQVSKAF
jgi:hemolysin activation/secretion protein